jgi:nucleoside-diphosphate-sugar epimerase
MEIVIIRPALVYGPGVKANFETMKDWVGQEATFTYFERTKARSYRHPLFKALRNYE